VPLANAFYVDAVYDRILVRPVHAIANTLRVVDGRGIDSVVTGVGAGTSAFGAVLRRAQNGNVQAYASGLVIVVLAIVVSVSLAVAQ